MINNYSFGVSIFGKQTSVYSSWRSDVSLFSFLNRKVTFSAVPFNYVKATRLQLVWKYRMRGAVPLVSPYAFKAYTVIDLSLLLLVFSLCTFMGRGAFGSDSVLFCVTVYLFGTKIALVLIHKKYDLP